MSDPKYAITGLFSALSLLIAAGWGYIFLFENYGAMSRFGEISLSILFLLGICWVGFGIVTVDRIAAKQWKLDSTWTAGYSVSAVIGAFANLAGFVYIAQGV